MNVEALISLGVTVIVLGILGLMILETVRLARHEPPITWFTRGVVRHYPGWAMAVIGVVTFVLGLLVAHFGWDA
jgi:hypothetical protein